MDLYLTLLLCLACLYYTATGEDDCDIRITIECPGSLQRDAVARSTYLDMDSEELKPRIITGSNVTFTRQPNSNYFMKGQTIITYTATNHCGYKEMCEFTLTLLDNTPPVLTCLPPQIRSRPEGSCQNVSVTYLKPLAFDAISSEVSIWSLPPSGSLFDTCDDSVRVIAYARDSRGNMGTCSFSISWTDDTDFPPLSIECPDKQYRSVATDFTYYSVDELSLPKPERVSELGSINYTLQPLFVEKGTTEMTYTATDSYGDRQMCTFNVTITDLTPTTTPPPTHSPPKTIEIIGIIIAAAAGGLLFVVLIIAGVIICRKRKDGIVV